MNDFRSGRPKSWDIYTSSDPGPSQAAGLTADRDGPWRSFGTSMNAISFGFVATAILISMFLIMAIFEHLFRPDPSFDSPQQINQRPSGSMTTSKLTDEATTVQTVCASEYPVVMPGQQHPTFIAQPAPLPCPREGIHWPNHDNHHFVLP